MELHSCRKNQKEGVKLQLGVAHFSSISCATDQPTTTPFLRCGVQSGMPDSARSHRYGIFQRYWVLFGVLQGCRSVMVAPTRLLCFWIHHLRKCISSNKQQRSGTCLRSNLWLQCRLGRGQRGKLHTTALPLGISGGMLMASKAPANRRALGSFPRISLFIGLSRRRFGLLARKPITHSLLCQEQSCRRGIGNQIELLLMQ